MRKTTTTKPEPLLAVNPRVPMPAPIRPPAKRRKYPFETMGVGGMFFVPNRTKNTMPTHASTTGKRLKKKFTTRLCWMRATPNGWTLCDETHAKAVQGIGVWRTA